MASFAVTYLYRADSEAERAEHRPAHVEFLRELYTSGPLYMSGPLVAEPPRALLIFESEDADALAGVLDADPFFQNGLISERTITPWNVFFDPRATGEV